MPTVLLLPPQLRVTTVKSECVGPLTHAPPPNSLPVTLSLLALPENSLPLVNSPRITEILVALKGPESTVEIFNLMSKKSGFESSFKSAFGFDFDSAIPTIAKTIAANWKDGV